VTKLGQKYNVQKPIEMPKNVVSVPPGDHYSQPFQVQQNALLLQQQMLIQERMKQIQIQLERRQVLQDADRKELWE